MMGDNDNHHKFNLISSVCAVSIGTSGTEDAAQMECVETFETLVKLSSSTGRWHGVHKFFGQWLTLMPKGKHLRRQAFKESTKA